MKKSDVRNLVGCCGIYCGLCNKFQSIAPSRCIGCKLGEQHSWCSIWNCCVKKHGLETCTECNDIFNCEIFLRRKVIEWPSVVDNLKKIKEDGLKKWLEEKIERQALLEELLKNYNEGRSMSFYCKVCTRLPVELINKTVEEANRKYLCENIDKSDVKSRAKILKEIIRDLSLE